MIRPRDKLDGSLINDKTLVIQWHIGFSFGVSLPKNSYSYSYLLLILKSG